MGKKQTEWDFANKVAWEGGMIRAWECGLTADSYDLSSELLEHWTRATEILEKALIHIEFVDTYLDGLLDEAEGE